MAYFFLPVVFGLEVGLDEFLKSIFVGVVDGHEGVYFVVAGHEHRSHFFERHGDSLLSHRFLEFLPFFVYLVVGGDVE